MKKKVKQQELLPLPSKGWKERVAQEAKVSVKTVYNTLSGRIIGPKSHLVIDAYRKICKERDTTN